MQQVALAKRELPYDVNEAMKLFRTNLQFCGKDKKVILITSTLADEGKSTISINLCRSLAQLGSKVIFIDADMRKSVIAESMIIASDDQPGLSSLLSAHSGLEDVLLETDVENFHIILAGKVPPNPAELLSNNRMTKLIEICRNEYDYVVIDCPPINLVVDAAIVAPRCDGVVMVVASNSIPYRLAQSAIAQMEATNTPILGVVLNMVDQRSDKYYYRKGYGYYKKYGYYDSTRTSDKKKNKKK